MIEIGKKYEVINSGAGNNGMIVTIIGYKGKPEFPFDPICGDLWYVDAKIKSLYGKLYNYIGQYHLKPIYDGDEKVTWESMKDIWIPDSLCV